MLITSVARYVRARWHPLWRLRQFSAYRRFQQRFDWTTYVRIPDTGIAVAIRALRDARYAFGAASVEPEIRSALALILNRLGPSVFWDVGANIGFYSWFVRQHSSIQDVVMFEPDPTNFGLITQTIQRNAVQNCRALNIALSDRSGETAFVLDRASGAAGSLEATSQRGNRYAVHDGYGMAETITCTTATIDSLISEGLPAPKLIKIDVEGAEHLVLAGGEACLERDRPVLVVETANADLLRRLKERGYRVFRIDAENVLFVPASANVDFAEIVNTFREYFPAA